MVLRIFSIFMMNPGKDKTMPDINALLDSMVNRLFEEDCLECMKRIPDAAIDMILCDLPYGMTQNQWDSYIPLDLLWEQYLRIIKPNGAIVLTSQGLFTARLILSQPKYYKYKWIWEKSKPTNFLNAKKQPLRKHEDVCVFYKKQPTYHPQMTKGEPYDKGVRKDQLSGSYGDFQPVHVTSEGERYPTDIIYVKTAECEGEVVHPTQKPIELGRYFIRTYSDPGDVVLDNTFGSGSFLVAALMEGRNFIGIEKNEDVALFKKDEINYIEVAKRRLFLAWERLDQETRQHIAQTNLIKDFTEKAGITVGATLRKNERSWAIELISKINAITSANDLMIKRAGGESTISTGRGNAMFPDVILYGNQEQNIILQGWELKMPDVPIEDETFIKDAQRKAIALNLNSCLIWNFSYAVLYIRDDQNNFTKFKQWDATSHIHSRADVETYRGDWEKLLERIILEINGYFVSGQFRNASFRDVISESMMTTLILRNKDAVADALKAAAFRDSVMAAYIDRWWMGIKSEYEHDETDKYKAYAKTIILNWSNRIIFAHVIKNRQNSALMIHDLDYATTPNGANEIFKKITSRCDFYNVFSPIRYDDVLPDMSWQDFVEFSNFLKDNGIEKLNQEALQNILEGTVATSKRAMNGQYTTPPELANLLVRLAVKDWADTVLDCCCGTGTISKAVIQIKKERLSPKDAVESVWACDKYQYPLQIANLSMTDADTIHLANRLFQHNALSLSIGDDVAIVNPETGKEMHLSLPAFGSVVSNFPFVPFEIIPEDDKDEISNMEWVGELNVRSDLYCYIAAKIADVLKPGGTLGMIVSNSWLGTNAGVEFIEVLKQRYHIKQVHISGKGRWFKNADVVTTIIVLEKKSNTPSPHTDFWLWKRSLEDLSRDPDGEKTLLNSALLGTEIDKTVSKLSRYSQKQIEDILSLNVCYNTLFHNVEWLLDVKDKMVPLNKVFRVFRGSRRGWDALFYPQKGQHRIENTYLKKVLINARNVTGLTATADHDAFCCNASLSELKALGHTGALEWISKFADQKNGVGKPLPSVLKRKGMEWYTLQDHEIAEIFTMMNPDQRLFFAKFETPSFVNQRLIGLTHKAAYPDEELNHALLNSIFTMFYIEASGFGRGLGVLDINKDNIANCYMLNPKLVSASDRQRILEAFEKLKARKIKKVSEELCDKTRSAFEYEVLRSFGMDEYFDKIKSSLLSMQEARATARE